MPPVRLIHPVFNPGALLLRRIPFSIQLRTEQLRMGGVLSVFIVSASGGNKLGEIPIVKLYFWQ